MSQNALSSVFDGNIKTHRITKTSRVQYADVKWSTRNSRGVCESQHKDRQQDCVTAYEKSQDKRKSIYKMFVFSSVFIMMDEFDSLGNVLIGFVAKR